MSRYHRGHSDYDCAYCEELAESWANDDHDFGGRMADKEASYYERTVLGL